MRIQLYTGSLSLVKKSGVGQAILHQKEMLTRNGVEVTEKWDKDAPIILNTVFPDSVLMALLARLAGRQVIYYGHSTMEDFQRSFIGSDRLAPLFRRWICFCYRLGDLVITPTDYSKALLERYRLGRPIYALSNGVDTRFFAPSPQARLRFRQRYGLSDRQPVVISAGHLIERKGILDFIELARAMPGVVFIWFGETPRSAIPMPVRKAIEAAPENLRFAGFVSQAELRDAYCGADLFAFLSKEETEGIVVLEALSCGVPVLLRKIPVYTGWLSDRVGVYMETEDFAAAAQEILAGKRPDLRAAGRALAESRSLEKVGERLKAIIEAGSDKRPSG